MEEIINWGGTMNSRVPFWHFPDSFYYAQLFILPYIENGLKDMSHARDILAL